MQVPEEVRADRDTYLKPGDHISIKREKLGVFSYLHEAIYIGNGEMI